MNWFMDGQPKWQRASAKLNPMINALAHVEQVISTSQQKDLQAVSDRIARVETTVHQLEVKNRPNPMPLELKADMIYAYVSGRDRGLSKGECLKRAEHAMHAWLNLYGPWW